MKRMTRLILTLLLLLTFAVPALADSTTTHTITITNTNLPAGHTYSAYQVFAGDLVEKTDSEGKTEKILTNIEWGDGVNGEALLEALKKDSTIGSKFDNCTTAIDVADKMKDFDDNQTKAFADVVAECLSTTVAGTSTYDKTKKEYTISVTGDGYYFIKDSEDTAGDNDAITRYMLQVVGNVTVAVKAVVPSLEKKIVEGENKVDANNASIGDVVKYELTSAVPDMTHYDQYYFIIHDTLSGGLTFNNDIVVKIGDKTLTAGTDYKVNTDKDNETFRIVFNNFIQYKNQKDAKITVTYSATLNEKAVLGTVGNPNEAHLEYSNNPNVKGEGKNEPGENDENITGETPKDTVYTYVTGIKLTKTDDGEPAKPLTGAKFKIEGTSVKTVLINGSVFVEKEDGTYYRLKDGTYTTEEPVLEGEGKNADKYESTTVKYAKVENVTKDTVTEEIVKEGWVGTDGVISFEGLSEGTYTITELIAPEGYNLLKEPIYIKIEWTEPTGTSTNCTWKAKQVDKDGNALQKDDKEIELTFADNVFTIKVENKAGNTLPSTGGVGTTLFYVIGGLLIAGAAVVLITRKRMSAEK